MEKTPIWLRILLLVCLVILAAFVLLFVFFMRQPPQPAILEGNISAPLDVKIVIPNPQPSSGEEFNVLVSVTPLTQATRIVVQSRASGTISGVGQGDLEWDYPPVNESQETEFLYKPMGLGRGELHVHITIYDQDGSDSGVDLVQFYYVGEKKTFSGSNGFGELEKKYLQYLRNTGQISLREYSQRLEKLESGGAITAEP